ncbi:hypothetical protein RPPS3_25470 [Rhodopseudomonas palustris]|uniref:DNA polymerase III subunit beta n=1 Tax=Rhodopseudomonas palustris TaxID=1076 RepID=UPI000D19DCC8|nr:DNA polymerase III subunit beta [Rhodopseudomonas palustris]AVT76610.1 hypothetical protein RPPS3_25470 [Rhodopseudomonas palustris]
MSQGKVTVGRDDLQPVLRQVAAGAAQTGKGFASILTNVLITFESETLRLMATDIDSAIDGVVPAAGHANGGITVTAALFDQLVSDFPAGSDITIEWDDDARIVVRCGRSRFTLHALPAADFPSDAVKVDGGVTFSMSAALLRRTLGMVSFAMLTGKERMYLRGALFERRDGVLRLVACDGARLAMVTMGSVPTPEFDAVLVPVEMVNNIVRMIDAKTAADAILHITGAAIAVTVGSITKRSKLVDARYPDYIRTIPGTNSHVALIEAAALRQSVDRVNLINRAQSNGRGIKLSFEGGEMKLSAVNADVGDGEDRLDVEQCDPFSLDIGFNGEFLKDMLGAIDADVLRIKMAGPMDPAVFEIVGRNDALFLLMPLRV